MNCELIFICFRYSHPEVVLQYAQWALERHEEEAAHIFTKRENALPLSINQVLEFLSPFPVATVSYLEYVVHNLASKVCAKHYPVQCAHLLLLVGGIFPHKVGIVLHR